jgi:hypothetical protein
MKKLVTSYTFDASAKTIVSADFTSLEKIQLITNVTDNVIIYNFAAPGKGGSLSGTTLTLTFDTTSMDDADKLQIFVEDSSSNPLPTGAATEAKQDILNNTVQSVGSVYSEGPTQIIGGVRKDSAGSPASVQDGDVHPLLFNEEGRLKVSAQPALYADVLGDITAIQGTVGTPVAGGTVIADVSRASNVMMYCYGTFATVNCTFEGCLEATGERWFTIQAVRTNANTIETTTGNLSAAPAYAWELSVNALARVRVRATARSSGTQSWFFKLGSYATEPIPAAQASATQPISGTVTATVGAGATVIGKARDSVMGASDVGVPALGVRRDTPMAETPIAGDYIVPQHDDKGRAYTILKAVTSTLSNVAASVTNVTVLALNNARVGATFYNDSTSIAYLKLGATASTTSFTVKLSPDDYYEIPFGYIGIVDCIWDSAAGSMRITEIS